MINIHHIVQQGEAAVLRCILIYDQYSSRTLQGNACGSGDGAGPSSLPTGEEAFPVRYTLCIYILYIQGTPLSEPARDITVRGIGFRDAGYTYMNPHGCVSVSIAHTHT